MATKKDRKCSNCGDMVNKDIVQIIDKKAYCPICGKIRLKEIDTNKKIRDFLYDLCGQDGDVMPFLQMQVKRLKNEYNYKPSGILATLRYIFETSENPPQFNPEYGIEYMVIRNYYPARKYHEALRDLSAFPDTEIDSILKTPPKEIHIKNSAMKKRADYFKNKLKDLEYGPKIDLDSLEDEEGLDGEV